MPQMRLTAEEAARLKRQRAKHKAHNASVAACMDKVKARLLKADPMESALLKAVLQDMRRLIR